MTDKNRGDKTERRSGAMAVLVHFKNNTCAFVPNHELDDLITSDIIIAFKRETGWVDIGKDRLRRKRAEGAYAGPERRVIKIRNSCLTCGDFVNSMCLTRGCSPILPKERKIPGNAESKSDKDNVVAARKRTSIPWF